MDTSNVMPERLFVNAWRASFVFLTLVFLVSFGAIIESQSLFDISLSFITGSLMARLILAYSGALIIVLCLWALDYRREKRILRRKENAGV